MTKIKKLTDSQIAQIPAHRDKWLKIGLSTEPLDFENAKAAAIKCYRLAGLKPPELFFRFSSPYSAANGATILKNLPGDQVRDQVWAQVRAQVWAPVRAQVGDQVWSQVWAQVWDQVEAQVGGQVEAQVEAQVRDQVRDQVGAQVGDQVWGNHDAYALSFYSFFKDVVGIPDLNVLDGLIDLAQHCGWWAPYKNVCILQDRPSEIHFDEQNRAHHENGMAIKYRDGFGVYCFHGKRVPEKWILEKETLDPAEILKTDDVELRAVGAEIVGWPRMASTLKRKIIDGDPETDIGALVEMTMPGLSMPGRFLMAKCPRNGIICEGVPYNSDIDGGPITTAIAAQAWRDGLPAVEYDHPIIRT